MLKIDELHEEMNEFKVEILKLNIDLQVVTHKYSTNIKAPWRMMHVDHNISHIFTS